MNNIYRNTILLAVMLMPLLADAQFYYGLIQHYGKNRVQYNEFTWTYHRYEQYDVFFYKGGKPAAEKAGVMAQRHLNQMQRLLDQPLDQRLRILVFNSLTDLKQSNLNADDEESFNTGGVTRTAGTRMFVYFNGDYAHFEGQIREGIAYLLLQNMLYGGFGSAVRNSTLLNMPEWYTEGLISFLSTPWNPTIDERIMDGFTSKTYKRINSLQGEEAKFCGHSVWQYISDTYGEGVIKNLIYMTIMSRSIDQSMSQVLGTNLDDFMKQWRAYYLAKYQNTIEDEKIEGKEIVKGRQEEKIFQTKLSADGRYMAYAGNRQGQYRVYAYDYGKKRKKTVFTKGFRIAQNNDYSYPLLGWNPNNRILAIITEEKGFIWLYFYDTQKRKLEKKKLFGFDKVLSFTYSSDGRELLMSAVKNGQSDIFVYTILSTSIDQITNDEFTDLNPAFIRNDKQIVFSSNRVDDSLRVKERAWQFANNMDLFVYHRDRKDNQVLWRLTKTTAESELMPVEYGNGYISFLSNGSGMQQRYLIKIDSSIAFVDTITHYNYNFSRFKASDVSRNITEESSSLESERNVKLVFKNKRFRIFADHAPQPADMRLKGIDIREREKEANRDRRRIFENIEITENRKGSDVARMEVNIDDYEFDPSLVGRYGPAPKPKPSISPKEPFIKVGPETEKYDFPPARNYFLTFLRDNFTSKLDFVFDNPTYQPFTGVPDNSLLNQGFNGQFKVGTIELLNDYKISGGLRTDFQPVPGLSLSPNSEFLIQATNHKKRLNKQLNLYRRSQLTTVQNFFLLRVISNEAHMRYIWPLNEVQSFHGSVGFRNQRGIVLSDNPISLPMPDFAENFGVLKGMYIHDNTRRIDLNILSGTRYKVFTEYFYNITNNANLHTAGIDFRNYTPIHRTFIFATRFAAGTSFGQEKLLHYLGGVDNAVNPSINTETPISTIENYKFQTVVTNMRGFRQNIRNGNSFAVLNGELRLPVFKYIINRPIRNDFISSFQMVGFGDLGTAWNGPSPWSDQNAFNNRTITTGNLTIIINRQTNPIIGGYGLGLRSRLFGYFVRADWAWGVENGVILPRVFYFSLSTDF